jgi:ribonuclease R
VIAELDKDAKVTRFEVVEGLMRAVAMVSYESVARSLGYTDKPALNPLAEAFKRDLKAIASLTTKLRQKRMRRGALDLDLPEPKIELDDQGAPSGVHQRAHDPGVKKAYQMVEELMLLANELVAQWLTSRKAPAIYRVHGKPDEEKLGKLMAVADALGAPSDLDELLEPKGVGDWLKRIQKHPRKTVLEGLLLRSLKQAVYDVNNVGHFGLASDAYLHFTSPIRRYPDLLVHRLVKALLRDGRIDDSPEALDRLRVAATRSSARERAAMSVEREVVDLYRALYMQEHLGEMFEGTVISFAPHGVFVNIEEPFVDVLVRFESIGRERYELSDNELYLVAPRSGDRIQLGDKMTVEIEEVSLMRRSIYGRRLQFSYSEHAADDYWTEAEVRSYQGRGTATGKRKARTQGKPESQDSDSRKSTPKRNGASNGAAPKRGGSSAKPANPPQKSAGSKPKGANGTAKNVGNNTAKNVGNNTAKNAGNNTTKNAGNNTTKKGNAKPTGGASQRRKASKGKRH